jgi:hypothetical protein
MYLCFIDESSTPPNPGQRGRPPFFVIAGVIIHEAQWHGIAADLKSLKARPEFNVVGEVKWRYFGPTNADAGNSVRHLDQNGRDAFRRAFYGILTRRRAVKIICNVTNVEAAYRQRYVENQEDLYLYTYKGLSERYQYFLQDMTRTVGAEQLGLVVADHRSKAQDDKLRERHHQLVEQNAPVFSTYSNYIETLFLTPSHNSVGIQFADMVAGAVGRRFNSGDSTYFDLVEPAFRKSANGRVEGYGLVRFPTAQR